MILSLQGCMAVGKTTAARYLEQHCQQVQVCFEDNAAVLAEIKQRGLNKNSYSDYLEIQRLFLRKAGAAGGNRPPFGAVRRE